MTITTLKDRITKATEKIEKKQNTIIKKQATIEKKIAKVAKLGFDYEIIKNECWNNDKKHDEALWLCCDVKTLNEDISRLEKEIESTKASIEKYNAQLAGEMEREALFVKEMPKEFTALRDELTDRWDKDDKERRDFYRNEYTKLGYARFIKKYNKANYEMRYKTDEEIHRDNYNDAKFFIIDLYNRVKDITGEVTRWNGIHLEYGNGGFPVLTGDVIGKNGRAYVETILAGGYNIQRLHIRTLVKDY